MRRDFGVLPRVNVTAHSPSRRRLHVRASVVSVNSVVTVNSVLHVRLAYALSFGTLGWRYLPLLVPYLTTAGKVGLVCSRSWNRPLTANRSPPIPSNDQISISTFHIGDQQVPNATVYSRIVTSCPWQTLPSNQIAMESILPAPKYTGEDEQLKHHGPRIISARDLDETQQLVLKVSSIRLPQSRVSR